MHTLPYIIALFPDETTTNKAITVSQKLKNLHPTYFTLQHENYCPHVTLYMAQLPDTAVAKAQDALAAIATRFSPLYLNGLRYYQDTEGMFEVQYTKTEQIIQLQKQVVASINPLRDGLLRERNPVGYLIREQKEKAIGEEKENLERYGYDEIGGLFRPHITFTRFVDKEKMFDFSSLSGADTFSGEFTELALFILGDHGTCKEKIARYPLTK